MTRSTGRYDELSVQALDIMKEIGECRIRIRFDAANIDDVRRAVRREARRRKVKLITSTTEEYFVIVERWGTEVYPPSDFSDRELDSSFF